MSRLFNEGMKQAYMDALPPGNKSRVFRTRAALQALSKWVETPANKNAYDMERNELLFWLGNINYASPASLQAYFTSIKGYIAWANEQGQAQSRESAMKKIMIRDIDLSKSIRLNVIEDARELARYLQSFDVTQLEFAVPAACFLWMGLSREQIPLIRRDSMDLRRGIMVTGGNTLEIPGELLPILQEYAPTNHRSIQRRFVEAQQAIESEYFLKRFASVNNPCKAYELNASYIYLCVNKLNSLYEEKTAGESAQKYYSATNIRDSGTLWRLIHLPGGGQPIDERVQEAFSLKDGAGIRCTRLWYDCVLRIYGKNLSYPFEK